MALCRERLVDTPDEENRVCCTCSAPAHRTCIKCNMVYYCDRKCQLADWPAHKQRCKVLQVAVVPCSVLMRLRCTEHATAHDNLWHVYMWKDHSVKLVAACNADGIQELKAATRKILDDGEEIQDSQTRQILYEHLQLFRNKKK